MNSNVEIRILGHVNGLYKSFVLEVSKSKEKESGKLPIPKLMEVQLNEYF